MNRKMQVISGKGMGHILAAFTRQAAPDAVPAVSDLVGDGLVVRAPVAAAPPPNEPQTFDVAAPMLEVTVVDFDANVIADPRGFAMDGGAVTTFSTSVSDTKATPPTPDLQLHTLTISLQPAAALPTDLDIWAQLIERLPWTGTKPERRTLFKRIRAGNPITATVDLTVAPPLPSKTDFDVLILASGYALYLDILTSP